MCIRDRCGGDSGDPGHEDEEQAQAAGEAVPDVGGVLMGDPSGDHRQDGEHGETAQRPPPEVADQVGRVEPAGVADEEHRPEERGDRDGDQSEDQRGRTGPHVRRELGTGSHAFRRDSADRGTEEERREQ